MYINARVYQKEVQVRSIVLVLVPSILGGGSKVRQFCLLMFFGMKRNAKRSLPPVSNENE
jgi:hypothetical protein